METTAVILGRFCPPHLGHSYVAEFARQFADRTVVVIVAHPGDPIGVAQRLSWVTEIFPWAKVLVFDGAAENLANWLLGENEQPIDFVIGSEPECEIVARSLSARYVPVDPERSVVPISGEELRQHPLKHWSYLPSCVRPHYVKRVCVFGPESTGKSTLTVNLARHFKTVAVPEWPRTMISHRNDKLFEDDFAIFARGQRAAINSLARQANRVIFCDTDPIITSIWADWLYGRCDPFILDLAESTTFDLYLLTDVDVPWVADPQRYLPEQRHEFFFRCKQELERRNRPFVIVRGNWDQRLHIAINAVDELFSQADQPVQAR